MTPLAARPALPLRSRRRWLAAGVAAAVSPPLPAARAGSVPRAILVPFSHGHVADLMARSLAELFGRAAKAPVVENVPGGGGMLALNQLLRRPRDGSTLLIGHSGLICNLPLLAKTPLEVDPQAELRPIGIIAKAPFLMVARRGLPADDLSSLRDWVRSRGEPLSFAASDVGSASHMAGEVLARRLGLQAVAVPYRDNSQAVVDVSEGRLSVGLFNLPLVAGFLESGRLKPLALLSDTPLPAAPGVRTVQAQGFGSFDVEGWNGLFAPAGTSPAVIDDYEAQLQAFADHRPFVDALVRGGLTPWFLGRRRSEAHIVADVDRYRRLLRTHGIT